MATPALPQDAIGELDTIGRRPVWGGRPRASALNILSTLVCYGLSMYHVAQDELISTLPRLNCTIGRVMVMMAGTAAETMQRQYAWILPKPPRSRVRFTKQCMSEWQQ